jgi:hypothetical protein
VFFLVSALSVGFTASAYAVGHGSDDGFGALVINLGLVQTFYDDSVGSFLGFGLTDRAYFSENWGMEIGFVYGSYGYETYSSGYYNYWTSDYLSTYINVMYRHSFFCISGLYTTFGGGFTFAMDAFESIALGLNIKAGMEWWFTRGLFITADMTFHALYDFDWEEVVSTVPYFTVGFGFRI